MVDDAIRFVSESETPKDKDREQVKSSYSSSTLDSSNEDDNKESSKPDYDMMKSLIKKGRKQEQ